MVGCCITRSLDLIVGMIAILKAGGAYVPLDPNYPKERFDFLLSDSRPLLILADLSLASTVLANCGLPILLADECETNANATSEGNLEPLGHSNSLAYVMYTSGSTGLPKV